MPQEHRHIVSYGAGYSCVKKEPCLVDRALGFRGSTELQDVILQCFPDYYAAFIRIQCSVLSKNSSFNHEEIKAVIISIAFFAADSAKLWYS